MKGMCWEVFSGKQGVGKRPRQGQSPGKWTLSGSCRQLCEGGLVKEEDHFLTNHRVRVLLDVSMARQGRQQLPQVPLKLRQREHREVGRTKGAEETSGVSMECWELLLHPWYSHLLPLSLGLHSSEVCCTGRLLQETCSVSSSHSPCTFYPSKQTQILYKSVGPQEILAFLNCRKFSVK